MLMNCSYDDYTHTKEIYYASLYWTVVSVTSVGSVFVRSTPPSRPNNIRGGLKSPSVGTSVRPQKVFFPISMKFGMSIDRGRLHDCTTPLSARHVSIGYVSFGVLGVHWMRSLQPHSSMHS